MFCTSVFLSGLFPKKSFKMTFCVLALTLFSVSVHCKEFIFKYTYGAKVIPDFMDIVSFSGSTGYANYHYGDDVWLGSLSDGTAVNMLIHGREVVVVAFGKGASWGYSNQVFYFDVALNHFKFIRGYDSGCVSNDCLKDAQTAEYGTQGGKYAPSTIPGVRGGTLAFGISPTEIVYLFGYGADDGADIIIGGNSLGYLNDIFIFDVVKQQFKWVNGNNTRNQIGVYERGEGVGAYPASRRDSRGAVISEEIILFHGGRGYISWHNDLWFYNHINNDFELVCGDAENSDVTKGVDVIVSPDYHADNTPGIRASHSLWLTKHNTVQIFGGSVWRYNAIYPVGGARMSGFSSRGDLWTFNISRRMFKYSTGSLFDNFVQQKPIKAGDKGLANITSREGALSFYFPELDSVVIYGGQFSRDYFFDFEEYVDYTLGDLYVYSVKENSFSVLHTARISTTASDVVYPTDNHEDYIKGIYPGARSSMTSCSSSASFQQQQRFVIYGGRRQKNSMKNESLMVNVDAHVSMLSDMWYLSHRVLCGEYADISRRACNGHGECISDDSCRCSFFHRGEYCQKLNGAAVTFVTILLLLLACFIASFLVISVVIVFYRLKYTWNSSRYRRNKAYCTIEELEEELMQLRGSYIPEKRLQRVSVISRGSGSGALIVKCEFYGVEVVLKQFSLPDTESEIETIEREIAIIQSLLHVYILRYIGTVRTSDVIGLVVEYCENGSLKRYLATHIQQKQNLNTLTMNEKMRIIHEISIAMSFVHQREIVHRDLKLGNILLTKELGTRISDFGLSARLSRAKTIQIGSSLFMSPEMILGKSYTESTDCYSAAIVFYILLTEKIHPFGEEYEKEASFLYRIASNPDLRPDSAKIENEVVRGIIQSLWSHVKEERMSFYEVSEIMKKEVKAVQSLQTFEMI